MNNRLARRGNEVELEVEPTSLSRTLASTETLQIAEIHALDAFCTPIEERFERLTRLGRRALGVPIIAITAITEDTQWFKSVMGWNISQMPLQDSLCARVVETGKAVMIGDLSRNPRYVGHPLVAKSPKFRFFCSVPLKNARGSVIGTCCAMSRKPRTVEDRDLQLLLDLACLAERELLTVALQDAQTALISKLSIARRQALIDPLTKTWNRRGGMMLIEEAMAKAERDKQCITVLAVDVDDFKIVNDTFGHPAGDKALRMVARELLACVRDGDGVCRFGGDEFFVVIIGPSREDIAAIADRIQRKIRRDEILVKGGDKTSISVSIGFRHLEAGESMSPEEFLAAADADLYSNKMQNQLKVEMA